MASEPDPSASAADALLEERRARVLEAALVLLRAGGLQAVTTAALAREARCSKETLYALFADRDVILAALVARQAARLAETLDTPPAGDPAAALAEAGARLLMLLTSEASLAINRAAIADPTGELSRILVAAGRSAHAPRLVALIHSMRAAGGIGFRDGGEGEVYRRFYGLLIGDRQILALHGVTGQAPDPDAARAEAAAAVAALGRLYPAADAP